MNAQVRQLNVEVRTRPTPAYRWSDATDAANDSRAGLALVRRRGDDAMGLVANPRFDEIDGIMADPEVDLLGLLPPLYPERLGDPGFLRAHHCRFAYVVGEMAQGIATPAMVVAAARAGMLGFHGSAGLSLEAIEAQIGEITAALGGAGNWGANLIANVDNPEKEMETAALFLRLGVRRVSASAFLKLTPAVVRIATSGLASGPGGRAVRRNFIFAKVSRPEVAEAFLSPAPQAILDALVAAGHITADEAALAATIPVASDLTVESDSGGHTDNRPLTAIFPSILRLRDDLASRHGFIEPTRVGAAGGLGTPAGVAAAFQLGAAYVVTGSVNQATPESGLCEEGKEMLVKAGVADVGMAPAADMFELGIKVQVLKRGSIFAAHANRLYDLYRRHDSLEALPAKDRDWLEKQILKMPVDRAWAEVRAYQLRKNNPAKVVRAEADPKLKMAMIFRRHLFLCSQWARDGNGERKADYQIWCGPAMGAFNDWVRGSFLESLPNRGVAQIGKNLLEGAAIIQRAQQLRSFGLAVRPDAFAYRPRLLA